MRKTTYAIPAIPKSVYCQLAAISWAFEHWRIVTAVCVVLLAIGIAGIARANCNTIPERTADLCLMRGYGTPDCTIEWEIDRSGSIIRECGQLTIVADNDVGEPLIDSDETTVATTTTLVIPGVGPLADIYSVTNVHDYHGLGKRRRHAPCIRPRCIEKQKLLGINAYQDVSELALLDMANIRDKTVMQPPDERWVRPLQKAFGAKGLPVAVTADNSTVADYTSTKLATTYVEDVCIQFALRGD